MRIKRVERRERLITEAGFRAISIKDEHIILDYHKKILYADEAVDETANMAFMI